MSVVQIATIEPITVAEAKQWLNIDYDDQDTVIASIIKAARLKIEKRCGISIALKQYEIKAASFEGIALQNPPIVSVDAVKYLDTDGVEQTVPPSDYVLMDDAYAPYLFPVVNWPSTAQRPDAVRVTYTSGIDIEDSPPDEVPDDLLQAMRLEIGAMFENREQELLVPTRQELMLLGNGVPELIAPYIVPRL